MNIGYSSITSYLNWGMILSGLFLIAVVWYICTRSKSTLPALRLLSKKIIGKECYHSDLLNASDKKIEDLHYFTFLHGLNFLSYENLNKFIRRTEKYDINLTKISKARRYFKPDLNKVVILTKPSNILGVIITAFLIVIYFAMVILVSSDLKKLGNEDYYLIGENSNWFLVNTEQVKASNMSFWMLKSKNDDWHINLDNCDVNELSSKAGISDELAQTICEIPSSGYSQQTIDENIKEQKFESMTMRSIICFTSLLILGCIWCAAIRLQRAREARQYLYKCYTK